MKKTLTTVLVFGLLAGIASAQDWKLGVQAFSLKKYTFCEMMDLLADMNVKYIEAISNQEIGGGIEGKTSHGMDAATRDALKAKLKEKGMKIISYGVVGAKTEEGWREIFNFAKEMGIEIIVAEPKEADLDMLSGLYKEYGIKIAIHNHTQDAFRPEKVLEYTKGREGIYASPDNGHWGRLGIKSIDGFKLLEGRMASIHLRDISDFGNENNKGCVPYGEGVLGIAEALEELKRQNYKGNFIIEYAKATPEDVKKCVDFFYAHAGDLAK